MSALRGNGWVWVAGSVLWLALVMTHLEGAFGVWHEWEALAAASHGPYAIGFALWIAYQSRTSLAGITPRPSLLGWGAAVLLIVLADAGEAVSIEFLPQLAVLLVIPALVLALVGWQALRALALPMLLLLCALPIWFPLSYPLQAMTAHAAATAIRWSGIPIFQDEIMLTIPAGSFVVAVYCAGIRYFFSAILVGLVYAYTLVGRLWPGVLVVGLAAVLSILGNWLRVYLIILLGHYTNMQHPWIEQHELLGWVVFAGLMVPPLLLARGLGVARAAASPRGRAVPSGSSLQAGRVALSLAGLVMALVTSAIFQHYRLVAGAEPGGPSMTWLAAGQQVHALPLDTDWLPGAGAVRGAVMRAYRTDDGKVVRTLMVPGDISAAHDLTDLAAQAYDSAVWRIVQMDLVLIDDGGGQELIVEAPNGRRQLIRVLFLSGSANRSLVAGVLLKLLQLRTYLDASADPVTLVLLQTGIDSAPNGLDAARRRLGSIARAVGSRSR